MANRIPLDVRFWSKVRKAGSDDCWLWTGATYQFGYGQIKGPAVRERFGQGGVSAHRYSWELHHGPIPEGLNVLHRCDVPRCCNPAHLFVGTLADNMRDMFAKGRGAPGSLPGERNGRARLAAADIPTIRCLSTQGATQKALAARFGVHPSTIGRVVRRDPDGWRSVQG